MSRNATWTNQDGLVVGFGTHSIDNDVPSVRGGTEKCLELEINLASLSDAFGAANRKPQEVIIPRGSIFKYAYIQTLVAAVSSGGGTLDLGTWGVADATDLANGIVDAVTVAEMTSIGEVHYCDGAALRTSGLWSAGAVSDSNVVIAPSYDTAVFQSGVVRLVVEYQTPAGSTGGTIAAVNS